MKEFDTIHFRDRKELRNWLKENHDKSAGIWMLYYKKHLKIACIEYNDALKEALSFGWIDSIIKKIDEEKYARKFTPRTDTKKWSDLNKRIVAELMQKGEMTQFGLSKIDPSILDEIDNLESKVEKKEKKEFEIPAFIIDEFAKNPPALTNFNNLAITYKKHFVFWIADAKSEETIHKRIRESIELLKENKSLGLK